MSEDARLLALSGLWRLEAGVAPAHIVHPCDGGSIEFEDVAPSLVAELWKALATPSTRDALLLQLAGVGAGNELLETLETEDVLREVSEGPGPRVEGEGEVAEVVRAVAQSGGFRVPALRVLDAKEVLAATPPAAWPGLMLVGLPDGVVLLEDGCTTCAWLRALGLVGAPGAEQTQHVTRPPIAAEDLSCIVAAALLDVERHGRLSHGTALLAREEQGIARGRYLKHPDCDGCAAAGTREHDVDWLRRELASSTVEATSADRIRAVFGDSAFAPVVMTEVEGDAGQLPFDAPYVFGDTRLSRRVFGRVFSTSLPGIVHGSAPDISQSRLLAWSEGVERLCAQSARADFPAEGRCRGLDLVRSSERLVPFARVGVMVPSDDASGAPLERTFTGAASHVSCLEAILHGTVEVLKRDAYMIAWYRKRRLPRLRWPAELPTELHDRKNYLRSHGLTLSLFDLRSDLPLPTLLLEVRATRSVGNWPAGGVLFIPAGGFTPLEALRHALALACSRFVGLGLDASPERDPLDAEAVARIGRTIPFWPALARYLDPARAHHVDFLLGHDERTFESLAAVSTNDTELSPRRRYDLLGEWLAAAEMTWIAVPLTNEYVVSAGLRVVKSLILEAVPLVLEASEVDRAHPRLRQPWPGSSPAAWNDEPHPIY